MIAVVVATRGLIYTRTMQCIFDGMAELSKLGVASKLITTHDLPIPDAQNYLTETALQDHAVQKLFFIEEDNFVFPDTFVAIATNDNPIVTVTYNDKNGSPHGIVHYDGSGQVLWAGLGATLIRREVFEKLGKPYFTIDDRYQVFKTRQKDGAFITSYKKIDNRTIWNEETKQVEEVKDPYAYGGQDINFYIKAREAGFNVTILREHKAHHFDLVSLGEKHTNNGCHQIRQV
jgi:hypothetical protein